MRQLIVLLTLLLVVYAGTACSDRALPELLPTATGEFEEDEVDQVGDETATPSTTGESEEDEVGLVGDETATPSTTGESEEDEVGLVGDEATATPISTAPEQALLYAKEDRSIWSWQPSQAPRQLTVARPLDNPENETAFLDWVISPDGRYLAYSHGRSPILSVEPEGGIHIIPLADRADSLPDEETLVEHPFNAAQLSPPVRLISLPGMLAWSPNSQQLAFVSYHEWPTGAVYVASFPDLISRRVADWPARALTWSSDGTYLAFIRADLEPNIGAHLLAWVAADGETPARVLEASVHDEQEVAWTDSNKLVAHIYAEAEPGVLINLSQFVMIEPTDATRTVLYEQYQVPVSDWLPEQDAFVAALYNPELGATGLYLIRSNGTVEALVTDDPYIDEYPFPLHSVADGLYVMWESDYTSCQVNLLELERSKRQILPTCNVEAQNADPDNPYLYTHRREVDEAANTSTLEYTVFRLQSGEVVSQGVGPTSLSNKQASFRLSANGSYVATIQLPQDYLDKGTGVTSINLLVDKWGESGNLVDEQATTWGPTMTWIPVPAD